MIKTQINSKSVSRIAAIQAIYQLEDDKNIDSLLLRVKEFYKSQDIKSDYEIDKASKVSLRPSYSYLDNLVTVTGDNIEYIDSIITTYLTNNWVIEKLPKLLLAILRVSMCELKYFSNTPSKVIINEYTDIASEMLDSTEVGFVNSILDKYALNCR